MSEQSVYVPVKKLVDFMVAALLKMGVPLEDAKIIADVLITSDLWGVRSHGVAHLKMYHERMKAGLQLPVTNWQVVKDTSTTAVVDGGNGMGMVVGYHAMKLVIKSPAVRTGCGRRAQFQPLWRSGILYDDGGQRGPSGPERDERAPVHRADVRRQADVRHQSHRGGCANR